MIVIRAQECRDCNNAVAARPVFDHQRVDPQRSDSFSANRPRADIGGSARSERHHEPDRSRRPNRPPVRRTPLRPRGGRSQAQNPKSHHDVLTFTLSEQSAAPRSRGHHASSSGGAGFASQRAKHCFGAERQFHQPHANRIVDGVRNRRRDTHSVADSPAPLARTVRCSDRRRTASFIIFSGTSKNPGILYPRARHSLPVRRPDGSFRTL